MRRKKLFLFLFFIILFPSLALAQTFEIYTYGGGNFLAMVFNGLKMLIEGGHISSLIKILLIVGLLIGVLSPVMGFLGSRAGVVAPYGPESFIALIKTGIVAALIVYGLMIPRANIAIIDRSDPSQSQVVSDVPFVNAFIAHVSSRIGDVIGKEIEDVIVPVDAVKFRRNGVAIGAKYLNEILDLEPPGAPAQYGGTNNVSISMVLGEYFERCVFPNFVYISGSNSTAAQGLRLLHESPNLLEDLPPLFNDPNIYFNVNFDESNPLTCSTAPGAINSYWNSIFSGWLKQVNYRLLGNNPEDEGYYTTVREIFERYFPESVGSFEDQVKQIAVLNAIRYALISYAARNGDYYIKDMLTEQKTGSGWIQAGRLFNKIVQTMRMLIEALVYSVSIFLPVFFAIAGFSALVNFIKINFWLQMWVPFYVILNAFADWQFARVISDALYNPQMNPNSYGISFATLEAVRSHANMVLGYVGAFSWSVPALAWGLLKGGEYAVTHALTAMSSGAGGQQTAQQVGAEVGGASNVSVGGINLGQYRFMDSTALASQAQMAQGLSLSESLRRVTGGLYGGSMTSAISGIGGGMAVDTAKSIGRGGVYGGDLSRARGVGETGELRGRAEIETFRDIARHYGGVEGFQSAISSRDFTRIGHFLSGYAGRMGISIGEAATQIGGLLATRELAETFGLRNALGTVGSGGLELSETQKLLSDVARAEQAYQLARFFGYAGGRQDFGGMYKGQLSGYAEQSWTLQDMNVVNKLNSMAADQGLKTRFYLGDRVTMAWTSGEGGEIERITLARAEAGASRESLDLTRSISGFQGWLGFESQLLNLNSARGVVGVNQPGVFNAPFFIAALRDSGAENVARRVALDIAKGREVFLESAVFDPDKGGLVSFALRRGGSEVVEDYTRTQAGWERREVALSTWERGRVDRSYDVSSRILDRGPIISGSSMWSAAVSGDEVLARRVYGAPTTAMREQELQEQAVKFAQDAASRLAKRGMLVSSTEYSAGGEISLGIRKVIGIDAGAEIGHRNVEEDNYNRIYGDVRRGQADLLGKLNRGEITPEEFTKRYTDFFKGYASEIDRLTQEKTDEKFGASSLVHIAKDLGGSRLDDKSLDKVIKEGREALSKIKDEDIPAGP
jgi:hypothetical protein